MQHRGKARKAAKAHILWAFILLVLTLAAGFFAFLIGSFITIFSLLIVGAWAVFALFTLYFFRDPEPRVPTGPGLIVAPAHGKVDVIDETEEPEVMRGRCKRVSIFLSVLDVHVQNAPAAGVVSYFRYQEGKFLNAMRAESATENENALYGFALAEPPGTPLAVRLIAGLIARRIVPWAEEGDTVARGERLGLIQFGSRVSLYLPLEAEITVKLGDKVRGGQTVVARLS